MKLGLKELLKYSLKTVLESAPKPPAATLSTSDSDVDASILTGAIYGEAVTITNHIYNIGNVECISFVGGPRLPNLETVRLDKSAQDYVRSLADQSISGAPQLVEGYISELHANRRSVDVQNDGERRIRVRLSDENFQRLRYHTDSDALVRFYGRPSYRFTRDSAGFSELDADSFEVV